MKVKHNKHKNKPLVLKMYEVMEYFNYSMTERKQLLEAYREGKFDDIGIIG
jgi:hypothetical protein